MFHEWFLETAVVGWDGDLGGFGGDEGGVCLVDVVFGGGGLEGVLGVLGEKVKVSGVLF